MASFSKTVFLFCLLSLLLSQNIPTSTAIRHHFHRGNNAPRHGSHVPPHGNHVPPHHRPPHVGHGHGHGPIHEGHTTPLHGVNGLFNFGDSLSDTGNLIRDNPVGAHSSFASLPYGQTMYEPTGRCSDGLLMIDFIAQHFKLPLLEPYLKTDEDGNFNHGVNFAVAGSTALDEATLARQNITLQITRSSLSVQLGWFRDHLTTICTDSADCKQKLEKYLVFMGEIGGNDINYALFQTKSMEDIQKMVPQIVDAIKNAVEEVIGLGVKQVVVPGNFAIGCQPFYLANFQSTDPNMYDDLHCLKGLNDLAAFQNHQLQEAVKQLQRDHPDVTIIYVDYYNALRRLLQVAPRLGFDMASTQKACCGAGNNQYNFNAATMCSSRTPVCPNPNTHVSWDGIHLTQHAYEEMSKSIISQINHGMSRVA